MAKTVKIHWTNRPARLVDAGAEQSEIEWLDTGTTQAISNSQFDVVVTDDSVADLESKHRQPKAPKKSATGGPSKQQQANAIYAKYGPSASRAIVIGEIMTTCNMSRLGAQTYYYNAKKAASKGDK